MGGVNKRERTVCELLEMIEIVPGGCFEWQGATKPGGYGNVWHCGRTWSAHRLMMSLLGFEVENNRVLHKCDNRKCIRPDHLFLGTQKDNMIDCVSKGRHGRLVLTKRKVSEIRKRYKHRCRKNGITALAREFGVSYGAIDGVLRNKNWAWIDDKPEDDQ